MRLLPCYTLGKIKKKKDEKWLGSYLTLEVEELCFISNLCLGIFDKDAKDICGFQNAKFEENREDSDICRQHCTGHCHLPALSNRSQQNSDVETLKANCKHYPKTEVK